MKSEISSKELGNLGEKIAADYLKEKGYKILDKNYIPKWAGANKREIDIIAKKKDIIAFVEVKTILKSSGFYPEDKVDFLKQRKIIKISESYLLEKKYPSETSWQIDVVAVEINPVSRESKIRHIENAVSAF